MPQNCIQFQHGQSLAEFLAQYGTQEQGEEALEHRRWPAGFVCPMCGGQAHSTFYVEGRLTPDVPGIAGVTVGAGQILEAPFRNLLR